MVILEGLTTPSQPNSIGKLLKSIYKLRQSSWAWYERSDTFLHHIIFKRIKIDPNIYIKFYENVDFIIWPPICRWFPNSRDDSQTRVNIWIKNNSWKGIQHDLWRWYSFMCGNSHHIKWTQQWFMIIQEIYLQGVFKWYNMWKYNLIVTPLEVGTKLLNDDALNFIF